MRFIKVLTVMAAIGLFAPSQASANAVLPWFDTKDIKSPVLSAPATQTDDHKPTEQTKKPKKRMLAMSIGGTQVTSRSQTAGTSSSCPLAVLVSLFGLLGIGTLTKADPLSEADKVP